jgi:hypothetical protein
MKYNNISTIRKVFRFRDIRERDLYDTALLKLLFIAVIFAYAGIQSGCKKPDCDDPRNPDCSNYDACIDAIETDADFGFYHRTAIFGQSFYLPLWDTLYSFSELAGRIWFRAHSTSMSEYEWTVGSDPTVFKDSVFHLTFDNLPAEYHLKVKLRVKNNRVNSRCFPSDTGVTEVEKTLVIKRVYFGPTPITDEVRDSITLLHIPIFGKYHGSYTDNQSDTCTFDIYPIFIDLYAKPLCNPDPFCQGRAQYRSQYGFLIEAHALECGSSAIHSIGILDKDDRDKLIITINNRQNDDPPRIWEGKRIR